VSVPAAAQALGISERAVRKRIHAGTLRAQPFGRSFMVWLPDDGEVVAEPGPEPGPAPGPEHGPEPIEAEYRVTPEELQVAIERTGAKYINDFTGLYEMINEALGRQYEARLAERDLALAAKDETIATQREALASQAERMAEQQAMIAEARRRAEAIEVEYARRREEDDQARLKAAQVPPETPGATGGEHADNPSPALAAGFWTRVRRVFGGE